MVTYIAEVEGKGIKSIGIENPYAGNNSAASFIRTGLYNAQNTTAGTGLLGVNMTSVSSATSTTRSSTEGLGQNFTTGAASGNNAGIRQTANYFRREWGAYLIARILPSSTSDIRAFIGFTSDLNDFAGETTLNNFSGVGIGKRAGDTNWFTMRNDGDATEDRVDSTIAFAAAATTIEIALDSTGFKSRINGVEQTAQTTELPAATTDLSMQVEIETGTGAADKNVTIFPVFVRSGPIQI